MVWMKFQPAVQIENNAQSSQIGHLRSEIAEVKPERRTSQFL